MKTKITITLEECTFDEFIESVYFSDNTDKNTSIAFVQKYKGYIRQIKPNGEIVTIIFDFSKNELEHYNEFKMDSSKLGLPS